MSYKLGDRVKLVKDISNNAFNLKSSVSCKVTTVFSFDNIGQRYQILYDDEIVLTVLPHEIELDKSYYREEKLKELGI